MWMFVVGYWTVMLSGSCVYSYALKCKLSIVLQTFVFPLAPTTSSVLRTYTLVA
jgi:hypothetical protein